MKWNLVTFSIGLDLERKNHQGQFHIMPY